LAPFVKAALSLLKVRFAMYHSSDLVAECQWLHLDIMKDLKKACLKVFPVVEYAYTTIPTYPSHILPWSDKRYPSGQIGFMVCCKDASRNVRVPIRSWDEKEEERLCRYYNKDIHRASFVLPTWVRTALNSIKKE
jgi:spermidine synthase